MTIKSEEKKEDENKLYTKFTDQTTKVEDMHNTK